jgi:hypothetical protein
MFTCTHNLGSCASVVVVRTVAVEKVVVEVGIVVGVVGLFDLLDFERKFVGIEVALVKKVETLEVVEVMNLVALMEV